MKRRILAIILAATAAMAAVNFSACGAVKGRLDKPSDVSVYGYTVSWDKVPNATGYKVVLDGKEYVVNENSFDVSTVTNLGGDYEITITAVNEEENYKASRAEKYSFTLPIDSGYDENGFLYRILEDGTGYEILKGNANPSGILAIPSFFKGLPVKKVADYAFSSRDMRKRANPLTGAYCNDAVSVIMLSTNLESIGRYALSGFTGVSSLVIPDSVTEIGAYAFYGCGGLETVILPKNLKVILEGCFSDCALQAIEFPYSVEEIGAGAFKCNSVTDSESGAVYRTEQNLTKVVIPDGVKVVGNEAFYGCTYLTDVVTNGKFSYFGYDVFRKTAWYDAKPNGMIVVGKLVYGYKSIAAGNKPVIDYENCDKNIVIPDYVTCIAAKAFWGFSIKSVDLPENVVICLSAFDLCQKLEKVIIPDGAEIQDMAFAWGFCKMVVLPKCFKLKSVRAFSKSHIKEVYYEGTYTEWRNLFESAVQADLFEEILSDQNTYNSDNMFYYYSETKPVGEGNYWHYVDGEVTKW